MKKFIIAIMLVIFVSACEAGNFSERRNRLHNMGRDGICQQNPSRCIDGTNIDW